MLLSRKKTLDSTRRLLEAARAQAPHPSTGAVPIQQQPSRGLSGGDHVLDLRCHTELAQVRPDLFFKEVGYLLTEVCRLDNFPKPCLLRRCAH